MTFEEMQQNWTELDRKLDETLRLNQQLLAANRLRAARTPLRRLAVALSIEAGGAFLLICALGNFIAAHFREPRFAWPAVLLDVWLIACFAMAVRQLVSVSEIHYDQPVLRLQKQIQSLRLLRLRVIRWALLTGQVAWWLPFLVVAGKAIFETDVYRAFGQHFFYINAIASGLLLPLLLWIAYRLGRGLQHSFFLQSLIRHVEGNYVDAALASLATVTSFEHEPVS